jgi:gamma-glutamylcyclotransferase (GGCT)/AIG2-like uncharacterized protein YtfP
VKHTDDVLNDSIHDRKTIFSEEVTCKLDWSKVYESGKMNNIYISWNPSINQCRRTIHFELFPEPISSASIFDNSLFNNFKKVQILISLSPHSEPNETRLLFEKHRKEVNGILYEIRYNLYAFNKYRLFFPTECFKTFEVREDEVNDVINDTMIFEQNNVQDNYILTIEAIPLAHLNSLFPDNYQYRNPQDPLCNIKAPKQNSKCIDCSVNDFGVLERWSDPIMMSLSIYAWYETEIVEIPFQEVTQFLRMTVSDLSKKKFKLNILEPCDLEIRVEGSIDEKYAIKISKFFKYKNSYVNMRSNGYSSNNFNQTKNVYLANNSVFRKKANSLFFKGKKGSFQVLFDKRAIGSKNNGFEPELEEILDYIYQDQQSDKITITIIAYSNELHSSYKASYSKIKEAPPYKQNFTEYKLESRTVGTEKFKFELPKKGGLVFTRELKGEWNEQNNFGDNKFNIQTFQKFHQNPGYVVTIKDDCQVQVKVEIDNKNSEKCLYKLNIFEIKDNYNLENILDYDDYITASTLTTNVLFLSKNKNGYLFLLFASFQDFFSSFKMTITSDIELESYKDSSKGICRLPWVEDFTGSIEPFAGGWIKMHNFLFNQSFIIIVGNSMENIKEELFIELSSSDKQQHIGVSVINLSSIKTLVEINDDDMNKVKTNQAFLAELNSFYLKVPQGIYMIIPTSYEPLENTERIVYDLKIFCSIGFKFKKINSFNPLQNFSKSISMVDQVILNLDMVKETVDLMVVIESIDMEDDSNQYLDFIMESKNEDDKFNFRKSVNLEKESFYHHSFKIADIKEITLGLASKTDRWLKLNLHIYSNQRNAFEITSIDE